MASELQEMVTKAIESRIQVYGTDIIRGDVDYDEYKRMTGIVEGLNIALSEVLSAVQKYEGTGD